MSTTIDERVVELRFDNEQFKRAAGESLNVLQKLGKALDQSTTEKNVSKIAKSIDGINFGSAVSGVEALTQRFSALGIVGKRVLENITDGIMGKFSSAVHSMTSSIISGGINRAMNIENARFQLQGIIDDTKAVENGFKNAGEMVQKVMDQASDSVDGTAYAYDSAAKAASMFAASGVKVGDQMEKSLKAVAGVSATFNANYEDISSIFTTIAGQGKVMADQLNQLSFRGMNAAATMANFFNDVKKDPSIASEEVVKMVNSLSSSMEVTEADIREFVSKGKINFDIFSEAMSVTFGDHAKDANKTFNGAMSNIRAALARTGAMFVSPLIKEQGAFVRFFNSIRKKINEFNKGLAPVAEQVTTVINRVVKDLSRKIDNVHVGTLTHAFVMGLEGVANVAKGLLTYLKPIGEAFTETFGGVTYKNILDTARAFKEFTANFKASEKTASTIKTVFKGVFDVVKTGIELIGRLITAFSKASDTGKNIGDSFNNLFSSFGRGLSDISKIISEARIIDSVFEKIANSMQRLKEMVASIADGISSAFGGIKNAVAGFENPFKGLGEFLTSIKDNGIIQSVKDLGNSFKGLFSSSGKGGSSGFNLFNENQTIIIQALADAIRSIASAFGEAVRTGTLFNTLLDSLVKGQLAIFIGNLSKLSSQLTKFVKDTKNLQNQNPLQQIMNSFLGPLKSTTAAIDEFKKSITRITSGLVKDLDAIARYVDAKAIKQIAEAILILAVALKMLASIDPNALAASLGAITAMLVELVGAIIVLDNFIGKSKGIKNAFSGFIDSMKLKQLSAVLLKMAEAVFLLAISVKMLSTLSWEELAKGLAGVTVLLLELTVVANKINPTQLKGVGITLIAVAIALRILVGAVKEFGDMNMETLAQGLIAVGVALMELALFTKYAGSGGFGKGLGLIAIATSLLIVGKVLTNLSTLSWEQIKKGLTAIGISLFMMATMIDAMPDKKGIRKAFIAIEMALAMIMITKALEPLTKLDPEGLTMAVLAMGAMMYGITKVVNGMPDNKGVAKAFAAIEMAVALVLISKALEPLSKVDQGGLLIATMAMGGILYAMVKAVNGMPDDKGARKAFVAIEMAVALIGVSKALEPLAKSNPDNLLAATLALGVIMVAMGKAVDSIPDRGAITKAFAAIEMAAAMWIIAQALEPLANVKVEGLAAAVIAIGLLIGEIAGVLMLLSGVGPMAIAGGFAAIEMAAAMWIVAQSLLPLTTVDSKGLEAAVNALGLALLAMTGSLMLLSLVGPLAMVGGLAAIEMAAAMWIVAQSLLPLTTVDTKGLEAAVNALGLALLAMTLSLMALSLVGPVAIAGGFAAVLMAGSMVLVATALVALSNIPAEKIKQTATALGEAIAILGGVATLIGLLAPAIIAAFMTLMVAAGAISLSIIMLVPAIADLTTVIMQIADAVKKFQDVNADEFAEKMPKLAGAIAILGLSLKAFGPLAGVGAGALDTMANAIQKLVPALTALANVPADTLKSVMSALSVGFAEFGLSLKAFGLFSGIGADALNTLSDAVMKLAPALTMLSKVPGESITSVMSALAIGFAEFGASLKSFGFFSGVGADAMNQLADSVAIMAPALMMLSMVPGEQIATVMGALGAGFKLFGQALKETPFFFANGRADALTSLCDGVTKLAATMPMLATIDAETLKTDLEAIGTAFESFGTALSNTPVLFTNGRAEAIGTLCDQMTKLADGIMYFINTVGYSGAFEPILTSIGAGFQSFGTAISNAPLFNSADRANSIGILCDQLMDLASGIGYFMNMNFDPEAFSTALGQVGTAFATFGSSLQSSPIFNTSDRAEGVATLVDTLTELTDGMNYFTQNIDGDGFSSSLESIRKAFFTFSQALANTPWFKADERAGSIKTMIDNIKSLAAGVNYFQTITTDGADTTLATIGQAMVNFGDAIKKTPFWNAEGRSNALTNVISSMNDLATAITKLSWIQGVETVMGALAGGVMALGDAFVNNWSGVSEDHVTNFGNAITAIQNVSNIDSEALVKVNDGIRNMLSWINTLINMDTEKMSSFSQALTQLANEGVQAFTQAFADTAGGTSGPMGNFVNQIVQQLKGKATLFMQPGNDSGRAYFAGIRAIASSDGPVAAIDIVNAICSAISALESKFRDEGIKSATAYINAIADQEGKARDAGTKLANAVLETLSKMADEFRKVGVNCVQGFANGLADDAAVKAVIAKATALGTQSITAVKNATRVESPSKEFRYIGEMCGVGFANGLSAMTQVVDEAGANLGKGSIKSLNDAINSIYALVDDYMEVDPTIRPTVDMSNIRRATDETTRLFNQAIGKTTLNAEIASAGIVRQRQTSSPEEIQNGTTNAGGNTYNFIQNNRSPKALSRVEIYRDTKSLFKQYREAVEGV